MQSLKGFGGGHQQKVSARPRSGPLRLAPVVSPAAARTAASPDSSSPGPFLGDLAPRNTLLAILERFSCKEFDALVPLLQPSHLQCLKSHASREDPPSGIFHQVVEAMLELKPEDHFLDSYSLRNLVLSQPDDYEELSHLRLSPDRWVQRFAVTSASSEESVLTFTLQRSNSGPTGAASIIATSTNTSSSTWHGSGSTPSGSGQSPATGGAGASTSPGNLTAYPDMGHISILASESASSQAFSQATTSSATGYKSLTGTGVVAGSTDGAVSQQLQQPSSPPSPHQTPGCPPPSSPSDPVAAGTSGQAGPTEQQERWRLVKVRGEPKHGRLPKSPSPEWSPESVVQSQLEALRMYDFSQVFNLLSPAAQSMVGPVHSFIQTMARNRIYRPLVSHTDSTSIRRCQSSRNLYLEIVRVDQHLRPKSKPVSSLYLFIVVKVTDQSSPIKDSWVVDQVKPVQDPKLLQALGLRPQEGGTQP